MARTWVRTLERSKLVRSSDGRANSDPMHELRSRQLWFAWDSVGETSVRTRPSAEKLAGWRRKVLAFAGQPPATRMRGSANHHGCEVGMGKRSGHLKEARWGASACVDVGASFGLLEDEFATQLRYCYLLGGQESQWRPTAENSALKKYPSSEVPSTSALLPLNRCFIP